METRERGNMGRPLSVRWDDREGAWCSDCGEQYFDSKGRKRRRTVHFRGVPKHAPKGGLNRPAAIAARDEWLETHTPKLAGLSDPTCEELCEAYFAWAEKENEKATVHTHRQRLAIFNGYKPAGTIAFGDRKASAIGPAEVDQLQRAMKKARQDLNGKPLPNGYSNRYINSITTSIVTVWTWAARPIPERKPERIFERNAMEKMPRPVPERKAFRYATPDEADAFLEFARKRAEAVVGEVPRKRATNAVLLLEALIETGARPSELCRATWADFNPKIRAIVYDKHKTSRKTGTQRVIFFSEDLLRKLQAEKPEHLPTLFQNGRGRPWTVGAWCDWFARLREAALAAGIECPKKLTSYWLRHSAISNATMSSDVPKEVLAELMGTSKEQINKTYMHIHMRRLAGVAGQVRAAKDQARKDLAEGEPKEPEGQLPGL